MLLIDNASRDGTPDQVDRRYGAEVLVVHSGWNRGYAGGNNMGLSIARDAGADVAFLINPDATVEPSCLEDMATCLLTVPNVGIVSPAILYAGSESVWYAGSHVDPATCRTFHVGEGEAPDSLPVRAYETGRCSGCVLGVAIHTFEDVGPLDERYFLYYEEAEWSLRIRKFGFRIIVEPHARASHDVGHGIGGASSTYLYYMTRNRLLLADEYGSGGVRHALFASILDTVLSLVRIARNQPKSLYSCGVAAAKGYVDFIRKRFGPMN